jgi:hypothetical protein
MSFGLFVMLAIIIMRLNRIAGSQPGATAWDEPPASSFFDTIESIRKWKPAWWPKDILACTLLEYAISFTLMMGIVAVVLTIVIMTGTLYNYWVAHGPY